MAPQGYCHEDFSASSADLLSLLSPLNVPTWRYSCENKRRCHVDSRGLLFNCHVLVYIDLLGFLNNFSRLLPSYEENIYQRIDLVFQNYIRLIL